MSPKCPLLILLALISLGADRGFAAAPTLTSFSPTSGILGTKVTLTGTNFLAPMSAKFNGVASASVVVTSATQATATVPNTASTGAITLKTTGGSVTSSSAFTVVPGMTISSTVGTPTSTKTVYFSGFGAYEAVDFYFDTTDFALVSASATGAGNVVLTVPTTATPGTHWITAVGRHSGYSVQIAFLVRTNWFESGFNPLHNGDNFYENVLTTETVGDLQEAWRTAEVGSMLSTPAVYNGLVYATFGDGSIRAYNEQTGALKWTHATGGTTMYSSPAVSGGMVYVGSSDDYFYALDANTGALKWRLATGNIIFGSPNVTNGLVYFGSYDDKVYAVNATTGDVVWTFTTGGAVFGTPAVSGGVAYVGSFDENIYALNATTGMKIWQYTTMATVLASPVLTGGLVCVGSEDKNMYALHAATGLSAWTYPAGGAIDSTVAVVGSTLFFGADDGKVYSLSAGGALRWSTLVPSGSAIYAPVCTANGVVYATDSADTYAFAPDTGELLTSLPVGSTYGGPVVVNGGVLGGDSFDGVLTRYAPNAAQASAVVPRPEPAQLRPRPLR